MSSSYACSSGGVMFVPDEIERATKSKSYKDFVREEKGETKRRKLFGRKQAQENKGASKAA